MAEHQRNATSRVLESLREPIRSSFQQFLNRSPGSESELRKAITKYVATFREHQGRSQNLDHWTAQSVEKRCLALLQRYEDSSPDERLLIQAAVLYFIETADAEDDLLSLDGFDDDLDVVTAVTRALEPEEG